ncbi:Protein BIG GRAIN 1-like protein E [Heracleum sosnowskyi]|uniref:Protein BIG GRAIN 1-like protein E n=1 Tax=Heracleum sosnowskyi TaxID=360622 RepID=A0AAD8ITM1_9APIA|nr:Protein BIG GRAIN 1-like protein E [Heracleum sosnowskyi]
MSIQQVPERSCKKLYHYRRDSDELDVFEAARYFSGASEDQKLSRAGGRNSLDITMMSSTRSSIVQAQTYQCSDVMMEKPITKEKKYKQPNSPGGRLASFLNSLFSQNSSKKKKSKSCSAQSMKDEDHEIPGGRRKRRSSISHFRSFNSTNNSSSADNLKSSFYSSSSSEFTTHPSTNTPTKNFYKDSKNYLDHHKPAMLLKNNCHVKSTASQKDVHHDTRKISTIHDNAWLDDDEFKFSTTTTTNNNYGFPSERGNIFGALDHEKNQPSERDFRNFINEMDDGADSDSSSDLFELQNYDLGCGYSSGLPVYETTHMNSINRGAPITS